MEKKISVALAGFGASGRLFHAPFISADPRFSLDLVWERSRKQAEALYPNCRSVDSYDDLLKSDCDLIVICTPNPLHFEQAKAALEAKKNVLIDKPFCESSKKARQLGKLAAERGLVLSAYQNRRFDSEIRTVKELLREGVLGEVKDLILSMDRFQKKKNPKEWKNVPADSVGILWDLGIHQLDQAYYLFGKPLEISCSIRTLHEFNTVSDRMDALLRYPSGLTVTLRISQCALEPGDALVCHGTKGTYVKHGHDIQEAMLNAGIRPGDAEWRDEDPSLWGKLTTLDHKGAYPTLDGNYGLFYDELYKSFCGGKVPVGAEDAAAVIEMAEACVKSDEKKRTVSL